MSLCNLLHRQQAWAVRQRPILFLASVNALDLQNDFNRATSHILHVSLQLRADHRGSLVKTFKITDATVQVVDDLKQDAMFRGLLEQLEQERVAEAGVGGGNVIAVVMQVPYLGFILEFFHGVTTDRVRNMVPHSRNWKSILKVVVSKGLKGHKAVAAWQNMARTSQVE
jgi:hypothetical protein